MERLTYYDCAGAACFDYESPVMNGVMANKAISRLAKYEDTGLTPEDCAAYAKAESEKRIVVFENYDELNKVRELLQAEREGRLVVLPCKEINELRDIHASLDNIKAGRTEPAEEAVERWKALAEFVEENERLKKENERLKAERTWIPVTERLPTGCGYYLSVVERIAPDELGGNNTRVKIMRWLGADWRYPTHIPKWINEAITETVTHWMPLPETPEKGAEHGR